MLFAISTHPAAPAGALVSDLLDGGAVRPLHSCIEGVRNVLERRDLLHREFLVKVAALQDTAEPARVVLVHSDESLVHASLPRGMKAVDDVDLLFAEHL